MCFALCRVFRALFLDIHHGSDQGTTSRAKLFDSGERGDMWLQSNGGRNPTGDAEVTACFALCSLLCALYLGIVLAHLGLGFLGFRFRVFSLPDQLLVV